jgi:UDP-GlcNAc:undecaprenyl-phosphate/decaprenyl-phosphate GlcNAc-1-phosphate transferase
MGWSIYFLAAVLISAVLAFSVGIFRRKSELGFIKRLGGVAIIAPLFAIILVSSEIELTLAVQGLVFGLVAILIFGIIDDIINLSWKYQLIFQVLLVSTLIILFSFSVDYFVGPFEEIIRVDKFFLEIGGFSFSVLSAIFILAWFLAIINSVNWADGINGLSGGIGMLGGIALFWISLAQNVNQPAIAILALIFIGAILGFWWNNFPKGRIEAGTSGSYAIGFFLATTAIMAGTKIATVLVVLIIPLVDFVWVMYERWQNKLPITKKDKRHLHYKLREYGWSDTKIVVYYFSFIATTLCLAFLMEARNWKFGVILLEIAFLMFFIRNISLKLDKKQKNEIKN